MKKLNFITTLEIAAGVKSGAKYIGKTHDEGIEIVDLRGVLAKINAPIKGKRNIIYCFGANHFVVTQKYFNNVVKKW